MLHLDSPLLRAALDGELDEGEAGRVAAHLAGCPECRVRHDELRSLAGRTAEALAALDPLPAESPASAPVALARLRVERLAAARERSSLMSWLNSSRLRPLAAGLGLVLVVAGALSLAPVRAFASRVLGLFRVEHIAVVPIDPTRLSELHEDSSVVTRLGQLLSDTMRMTRPEIPRQVVPSAEEASKLCGYAVRMPAAGEGTPRLSVQGGAAFEMEINRERAQSILDDAGKTSIRLPESLDGARLTVDTAPAVTLEWGNCLAEHVKAREERGPGRRHSRFVASPDCLVLAQMPSPRIDAPADLDVARLARVALELAGMDSEEIESLTRGIDWTSTLVVPIPSNAGSVKPIEVDGTTGTLVARTTPEGLTTRYTLLWTKEGRLHALVGYGDPARGLQVADSLR